jgi:hypothetical protein
MINPDNDELLSLSRAVFEISQRGVRQCSLDAVRRAAERIGALHFDERGYGRIPRKVVATMARNYKLLGVFTRRGQRSTKNLGAVG